MEMILDFPPVWRNLSVQARKECSYTAPRYYAAFVEGEISGGGTLSGDIDAFGIYAENGNAGEHFRIDNFTINTSAPSTAVPEPASITLWSMIGLGLAGFGYRRLRRKK